MSAGPVRNFHLPLPSDTYERMKDEAARQGRPATSLAREAIEEWLRARQRLAVSEEIAAYAATVAGTREDLDPDLERSAVAHLEKPRKTRR